MTLVSRLEKRAVCAERRMVAVHFTLLCFGGSVVQTALNSPAFQTQTQTLSCSGTTWTSTLTTLLQVEWSPMPVHTSQGCWSQLPQDGRDGGGSLHTLGTQPPSRVGGGTHHSFSDLHAPISPNSAHRPPAPRPRRPLLEDAASSSCGFSQRSPYPKDLTASSTCSPQPLCIPLYPGQDPSITFHRLYSLHAPQEFLRLYTDSSL